MKKVKLFYFPTCPHCKKALRFYQELKDENPRYSAVEIEMIDEQKNPEIADQYDYYYVPTFYVGDEKVHEGSIERDDVRRVLERALG